MPEITILIDEELMRHGREYADKHQASLENLIRKLLEETVKPQSAKFDECFKIMNRAEANSGGKTWYRVEIYNGEDFH